MTNSNVLTVDGAVNSKGKPVKISISDSISGNSFGFIAGTTSNTIQGTSKADIIRDTNGNDLLKGGSKNDLFIFSAGNDTIGDYSVTKNNSDTITLTGGLAYEKHYIVGKKNKDVLITFKGISSETTSLTLTNAKSKIATINGTAVDLSDPREKVFAKTDSTTNYTATSDNVTINAANLKNGINITGNSLDNVIKGSAKNDVINAGSGNDTITTGSGKDLIVYSSGNDVITDYAAGKDTLQANITDASVDGKNLKLTTSNGTITLNKAAKKKITLTTDGQNSVTQVLGAESISVADADGSTIDATKSYNAKLKMIDASKRKSAITIIGNSLNNTLRGGKGNDILTGSSGTNTFVYTKGDGSDTITDYKADDMIVLGSKATKVTSGQTSGNDYVLTVGTGSITFKNAANTIISVKDSKGTVTKYNDSTATVSSVTTISKSFVEKTYDELFANDNYDNYDVGSLDTILKSDNLVDKISCNNSNYNCNFEVISNKTDNIISYTSNNAKQKKLTF